jgi:hypothetical protein
MTAMASYSVMVISDGINVAYQWRNDNGEMAKWQCGAAKKILMAINQPINGNDVA